MKKIITTTLFIFTFILSLSTAGHAEFLIGIKTQIGMSSIPLSEAGETTSESKVNLGFSAGVDGYYYFNDLIGLHFNVGYNLIQGTYYDKSAGVELYSRLHLTNIDIGASLKVNRFYFDFDLSFNIRLAKLKINENGTWITLSSVDQFAEEQDFIFALALSFGYRIDFGKVKLPVGLSFKYYISPVIKNVENAGDDGNMYAWSLLLTVGVLF